MPIRKNVCLVTPDISGFIINGGVGTSTIEFARTLVRLNYKVDILFANRKIINDQAFVWWQAKYLEEGINLISVKSPPYTIEHGHEFVRISYAVYHHLKKLKYDRIIFTEMFGAGFYCLKAKQCGLEFQNTELWVIFHGPTIWHLRNNEALPTQFQQLSTNYMEAESVALADRVLFATEHSKKQAIKIFGKIAQNSSVELFPFWKSSPIKKYTTCEDLVFFGRIESRKGIEDFLEALKLLKDFIKHNRINPVLIGHIGLIKGEDARKYLMKWQQETLINLQIIEGKNQVEAWDEIVRRKCLIVLASREETMGYTFIECLTRQVPFIYSNIPAFVELANKLTKKAIPAFEPKSPISLAKAIRQRFFKPIKPKMRALEHELFTSWRDIFKQNDCFAGASTFQGNISFSVCIPHHNRINKMLVAIDSVVHQKTLIRELIVYNDPPLSKNESAKIVNQLRRIETNWKHDFPLKIIYGKNNRGPSFARNRMAEVASGSYLIFLDDDNKLKSNAIKDLRKVIRKLSPDFVVSAIDRKQLQHHSLKLNSAIWPPVGNDISLNLFHNQIGDANCCIRKDAYHMSGGFNESLRVFEDQEFFLRASIKGFKFSLIPKPLIDYFLHEDNAHLNASTEENRHNFFIEIEKSLTNGFTPLLELVQAWAYSQPPTSTWEWGQKALIGEGRSDWDSWTKLKKSDAKNFKLFFNNQFVLYPKGLFVRLNSKPRIKKQYLNSKANLLVRLTLWLPQNSLISTGQSEIFLFVGKNDIVITVRRGEKISIRSVSGALSVLISRVEVLPISTLQLPLN